ncbi:hypothetical protein MTsN3n11_10460 [Qipengyuania sp. MTN3-11]
MLLRPEPGWSASAARAREMGLEVAGAPLVAIEAVDWRMPEGEFDGLLAGSANVFRCGGDTLERLRHLPAHCVGKATASAALAAGFEVAFTGTEGLQAALDAIAPPARMLRLTGEERVALSPPEGVAIVEITAYRSRRLPMAVDLLPPRAVIACHSGTAAAHFAHEVDRLSRDRTAYVLCALSARVAREAGAGWQSIHIADSPDDAALLALAGRLCQGAGVTASDSTHSP